MCKLSKGTKQISAVEKKNSLEMFTDISITPPNMEEGTLL